MQHNLHNHYLSKCSVKVLKSGAPSTILYEVQELDLERVLKCSGIGVSATRMKCSAAVDFPTAR